jgi:hypothetical protein
MTLGGKQMSSLGLMQWIGILLVVAGAALMAYAAALVPAWTAAHPLIGLLLHVNWLLLTGLIALLGGGVLVQVTWRTQHG